MKRHLLWAASMLLATAVVAQGVAPAIPHDRKLEAKVERTLRIGVPGQGIEVLFQLASRVAAQLGVRLSVPLPVGRVDSSVRHALTSPSSRALPTLRLRCAMMRAMVGASKPSIS